MNNPVLFPLGLTAGVVVLDDLFVQHKLPPPRTFIAITLTMVILAALADPAPKFAIPLAYLLLVAVLLTKGADVFKGIAKRSSTPKYDPAKFTGGQGGQFAGHGASGSF